MSSSSTVHYWVRGTPFHREFVEIAQGSNISTFKNLVFPLSRFKLYPQLAPSNVASLRVYKIPDNISVPDTDAGDETLGMLSISSLGKHLRDTQKISSVIKPRTEEFDLDFIIDAAFDIDCWIQGEEDAFRVPASSFMDVSYLRDVIQNKLPQVFSEIPVTHLKLYKISPTDASFPGIPADTQPLPGDQFLGTVFQDVPFSRRPAVFIAWTEAKEKRKHVLGDPDDVLPKTKRRKIAAAALLCTKPSEPDDLGLVDGRRRFNVHPYVEPLHSRYPPIELQYEGFGLFLDIFRGREGVPGVEKVRSTALKRAVDMFAEHMTLLYHNEYARRGPGLDLLNEIIRTHHDLPGFCLIPAEVSPGNFSDGHVNGPHKAAYCIAKFTNEPGAGPTVPYVELSGYFAHSVRQAMECDDNCVRMFQAWNVPCLGMTITGYIVTFFAMLFVSGTECRWHVVPLTPGLSCIQVASGGDDRTALYRAFTAATILLAHIRGKATQVAAHVPAPIPNKHHLLPYVSELLHPSSGSRVHFNIDETAVDERETHRRLLYFAKTTNGKDILVKFTPHYSCDLHMVCAEHGCAPELLGFERLPGGFYGVAMEYAEPPFSNINRFAGVSKVRTWAEQLQTVVKAFHAKNLVHGDLRTPNILCDGDKVMIVDFDWGGKEGEVFYPHYQLAPELTEGRDGADLTITKNDDLRVLCKTLKHIGVQECNYCAV